MKTPNKKLGITGSSTGKTSWSWVTYNALLHDKEQNIQVIEWPNGEGFTVLRNDETEIHIDWDEWRALKTAVNKLGN
jgi:hypothetical protein